MPKQFNLIKYLSAKRNRTKVDHAMSVAAILHPLMALPQLIQVYSSQSAGDLSLFMWLAWLALGLVFMAYGLAHRLRPYVTMQILWIIIDMLMIAGIVIYG